MYMKLSQDQKTKVAKNIRSQYATAAKKGMYLPPTVARARALKQVVGK